MKRTRAALTATAGLVAALALSGCVLSDISPTISGLAGNSVQDALDPPVPPLIRQTKRSWPPRAIWTKA